MASQNRPGAARCEHAASGSSAKANRTSTSSANGSDLVGRDPAARTRCAGPWPPPAGDLARHHPAAARSAGTVGRPSSPPWPGSAAASRPALRRCTSPPTTRTVRSASAAPAPARGRRRRRWRRPPRPRGAASSSIVAARGVEAGVRLVEQPQLGTAGASAASAVRRRCPADSRATFTSASRPVRPRRVERGVDLACGAPTVRPQKRTFSTTVRSSYSPLACPSSPTLGRTDRARSEARSRPSTRPSPRSSGSRPAQRRSSVVLPAPFGPWRRTISPRSTANDGTGQRGEPPEHRHGVAEVDHRVHRPAQTVLSQPERRQRRPRK